MSDSSKRSVSLRTTICMMNYILSGLDLGSLLTMLSDRQIESIVAINSGNEAKWPC